MPDPIITTSILLRLLGVGYSMILLYRVRDARFGFLTAMLSLMAMRQFLTLQSGGAGLQELPGLAVSVFGLLTVYYLSQYVEQEGCTKREIQTKNEQLRGFRKAIEHAGHAIFITDTDGTITYANPAVESITGYSRDEVLGSTPAMWNSGEHDETFYTDMWDTILDGEVWDGEIINERKNGELCWVDMTIAPITDETGTIERFVAVDTDVTDRKERELHIQQQHERLAILNDTNEIIRDVNQDLVRATNREEIERTVCDRFATADPYAFAWVGDRNMVNESIAPRTWVGIDGETLHSFVDSINDDDGTLISRAIETGEVQVATDLADGCDRSSCSWRRAANENGSVSAAAVPLVYDETLYGILEIHATTTDVFDAIGRDVFAELGETIAHAINAAESKAALVSDSVVELEFSLTDSACPFVDLSTRVSGRLTLERTISNEDGLVHQYFSVTDVDPAKALEQVCEAPSVDHANLVCESDDDCLVRIETSRRTVVTELADHGALVTSVTAKDGEGRLTVELPRTANVRGVVEALQNAHPRTDLLAYRERERPVETKQGFRATLEDSLTDRQLETLETAYINGFFKWPRQNTGEEIADVMGISQSTFLQHLRAANRKLLDTILDDEPVPSSRRSSHR
ncbi:bacterio-opsin activator domain-containing protein [Haladaptatus sp. NG-SE-30]